MKPADAFTTQYRKFKDTERYMVEVSINDYLDIFNEWDPVPFKRRSLHPELQDFLEECSREISIRHPLAIVFYIPKIEHDPEKETFCITGISNHFAFKIHVLNKELGKIKQGVIRNSLIGLVFLSVAVYFEQLFAEFVYLKVLGQGLFIGGWVFIWEALSTLVFKNAIMKHKIKEWQRFLDAPIIFMKENKPENVSSI